MEREASRLEELIPFKNRLRNRCHGRGHEVLCPYFVLDSNAKSFMPAEFLPDEMKDEYRRPGQSWTGFQPVSDRGKRWTEVSKMNHWCACLGWLATDFGFFDCLAMPSK